MFGTDGDLLYKLLAVARYTSVNLMASLIRFPFVGWHTVGTHMSHTFIQT